MYCCCGFFKKKIIRNKRPVCHPELVEVFSSEERGKTEER